MAAKSVLSIQIVPYIPILRVCEPIATTLRVVVTSAFYTPPALNYPPYPPLPNTYNPTYSDPLVV